ncbi:MAG TPA: serine/threonine-protein kinase [Coleofasciculaceae cyanobacterium]
MKGKILGSRYQVLEYIAKGGFGRTYLAQDTQLPGKDLCVVKQLSPSFEAPQFLTVARRLFKTEASALHSLGSHDQIPELLAYFEEEEKFYLVQQYIEGETLEHELTPEQVWSQAQVIELLEDGLKILDFIHTKGVIHRDIKPDNLIRRSCDRKIVLVDFGTVKNLLQGQTNLGQLTVPVGTKGYMSTEQARGKPRPTSDVYALGIIGIQALTGVEPLELEEDDDGELIWTHLAKVDPQLAEILTQMTRYQFEDRYQSAQTALQALTAFSQAGTTKPQSITTINQSVLNNLDTTHSAIAASARAENELVAPSLLPDANLPNSIEQSQSHSVPINRQTAPTEIDSSSEIKPQFAKIISAIAIALGTMIIGGIYLLMQQSILKPQLNNTPAPSEIPNSSTPRMKQGEGFRKNL